jgi:hypothetical protein
LDPSVSTGLALLIDLVLKVIGAGGVVTVVVYMVKLSNAWGRMEERVERFTVALEKIDRRLDTQNERIAKLANGVSLMQGEHLARHGGE